MFDYSYSNELQPKIQPSQQNQDKNLPQNINSSIRKYDKLQQILKDELSDSRIYRFQNDFQFSQQENEKKRWFNDSDIDMNRNKLSQFTPTKIKLDQTDRKIKMMIITESPYSSVIQILYTKERDFLNFNMVNERKERLEFLKLNPKKSDLSEKYQLSQKNIQENTSQYIEEYSQNDVFFDALLELQENPKAFLEVSKDFAEKFKSNPGYQYRIEDKSKQSNDSKLSEQSANQNTKSISSTVSSTKDSENTLQPQSHSNQNSDNVNNNSVKESDGDQEIQQVKQGYAINPRIEEPLLYFRTKDLHLNFNQIITDLINQYNQINHNNYNQMTGSKPNMVLIKFQPAEDDQKQKPNDYNAYVNFIKKILIKIHSRFNNLGHIFNQDLGQKLEKDKSLFFHLQSYSEGLDRMTQGEVNSVLALKNYVNFNYPYLTVFINPSVLGVCYFYYIHLNLEQTDGSRDQIYSLGTLPQITLLNLDGFDNPINFFLLHEFKTIQYISIANDNISLQLTDDQKDVYSFYDSINNIIQIARQPKHFVYLPVASYRVALNQRLSKLDKNKISNEDLKYIKEILHENHYKQANTDSTAYMKIIRNMVIPLVKDFNPDVCVVSQSFALNVNSHHDRHRDFITQDDMQEILLDLKSIMHYKLVLASNVIYDLKNFEFDNQEFFFKIVASDLMHEYLKPFEKLKLQRYLGLLHFYYEYFMLDESQSCQYYKNQDKKDKQPDCELTNPSPSHYDDLFQSSTVKLKEPIFYTYFYHVTNQYSFNIHQIKSGRQYISYLLGTYLNMMTPEIKSKSLRNSRFFSQFELVLQKSTLKRLQLYFKVLNRTNRDVLLHCKSGIFTLEEQSQLSDIQFEKTISVIGNDSNQSGNTKLNYLSEMVTDETDFSMQLILKKEETVQNLEQDQNSEQSPTKKKPSISKREFEGGFKDDEATKNQNLNQLKQQQLISNTKLLKEKVTNEISIYVICPKSKQPCLKKFRFKYNNQDNGNTNYVKFLPETQNIYIERKKLILIFNFKVSGIYTNLSAFLDDQPLSDSQDLKELQGTLFYNDNLFEEQIFISTESHFTRTEKLQTHFKEFFKNNIQIQESILLEKLDQYSLFMKSKIEESKDNKTTQKTASNMQSNGNPLNPNSQTINSTTTKIEYELEQRGTTIQKRKIDRLNPDQKNSFNQISSSVQEEFKSVDLLFCSAVLYPTIVEGENDVFLLFGQEKKYEIVYYNQKKRALLNQQFNYCGRCFRINIEGDLQDQKFTIEQFGLKFAKHLDIDAKKFCRLYGSGVYTVNSRQEKEILVFGGIQKDGTQSISEQGCLSSRILILHLTYKTRYQKVVFCTIIEKIRLSPDSFKPLMHSTIIPLNNRSNTFDQKNQESTGKSAGLYNTKDIDIIQDEPAFGQVRDFIIVGGVMSRHLQHPTLNPPEAYRFTLIEDQDQITEKIIFSESVADNKKANNITITNSTSASSTTSSIASSNVSNIAPSNTGQTSIKDTATTIRPDILRQAEEKENQRKVFENSKIHIFNDELNEKEEKKDQNSNPVYSYYTRMQRLDLNLQTKLQNYMLANTSNSVLIIPASKYPKQTSMSNIKEGNTLIVCLSNQISNEFVRKTKAQRHEDDQQKYTLLPSGQAKFKLFKTQFAVVPPKVRQGSREILDQAKIEISEQWKLESQVFKQVGIQHADRSKVFDYMCKKIEGQEEYTFYSEPLNDQLIVTYRKANEVQKVITIESTFDSIIYDHHTFNDQTQEQIIHLESEDILDTKYFSLQSISQQTGDYSIDSRKTSKVVYFTDCVIRNDKLLQLKQGNNSIFILEKAINGQFLNRVQLADSQKPVIEEQIFCYDANITEGFGISTSLEYFQTENYFFICIAGPEAINQERQQRVQSLQNKKNIQKSKSIKDRTLQEMEADYNSLIKVNPLYSSQFQELKPLGNFSQKFEIDQEYYRTQINYDVIQQSTSQTTVVDSQKKTSSQSSTNQNVSSTATTVSNRANTSTKSQTQEFEKNEQPLKKKIIQLALYLRCCIQFKRKEFFREKQKNQNQVDQLQQIQLDQVLNDGCVHWNFQSQIFNFQTLLPIIQDQKLQCSNIKEIDFSQSSVNDEFFKNLLDIESYFPNLLSLNVSECYKLTENCMFFSESLVIMRNLLVFKANLTLIDFQITEKFAVEILELEYCPNFKLEEIQEAINRNYLTKLSKLTMTILKEDLNSDILSKLHIELDRFSVKYLFSCYESTQANLIDQIQDMLTDLNFLIYEKAFQTLQSDEEIGESDLQLFSTLLSPESKLYLAPVLLENSVQKGEILMNEQVQRIESEFKSQIVCYRDRISSQINQFVKMNPSHFGEFRKFIIENSMEQANNNQSSTAYLFVDQVSFQQLAKNQMPDDVLNPLKYAKNTLFKIFYYEYQSQEVRQTQVQTVEQKDFFQNNNLKSIQFVLPNTELNRPKFVTISHYLFAFSSSLELGFGREQSLPNKFTLRFAYTQLPMIEDLLRTTKPEKGPSEIWTIGSVDLPKQSFVKHREYELINYFKDQSLIQVHKVKPQFLNDAYEFLITIKIQQNNLNFAFINFDTVFHPHFQPQTLQIQPVYQQFSIQANGTLLFSLNSDLNSIKYIDRAKNEIKEQKLQ